MKRTDPHSPSSIVLTDYEFVTCFGLAREIDGWPVPSYGIEHTIELRKQAARDGVTFSPVHAGLNVCDVCGAHFLDGCVWRHLPTGDYVTLGHTCADKYEFASEIYDSALKQAMRKKKETIAAALRRRERIEKIADAREFLRADPELRAALRVAHDHPIVSDVRGRLLRWGSISDKQRALLLKIGRERAEREAEAANPAAPTSPIPETDERHSIRARIVRQYTRTDDYTGKQRECMIVEWDRGDETVSKLWGTAPAALLRAYAAEDERRRAADEPELTYSGAVIEFKARVKRSSDDEAFGFVKRPTSLKVISWGE